MDLFRIRLAKESFKFSSTHFTLFSATDAERLHGHNYQVSVECELNALGTYGMGFEFNSLKPLVKKMTDGWDERVLLPRKSAHLRFQDETVRGEEHLVVDFHTRSYRLPKQDVVLLETENITSEELARLFAVNLAKAWKASLSTDDLSSKNSSSLASRVRSLTITVEETRGQNASYVMELPLVRSDLQ